MRVLAMQGLRMGLIAVGVLVASGANANNLLTLDNAAKGQTIESIGVVPEKKEKNLKLGVLRTREAQLPGGLLSLEDRMRLRAKRALSRQREVSFARRKSPEDRSSGNNRSRARPMKEQKRQSYSDNDQLPPNSGDEDEIIIQ